MPTKKSSVKSLPLKDNQVWKKLAKEDSKVLALEIASLKEELFCLYLVVYVMAPILIFFGFAVSMGWL